jgi:hypothetical protein
MYIPIRAILIAILLVIGIIPASGGIIATADGTWWQSLTDEEGQNNALLGLTSGFTNGYSAGFLDARAGALDTGRETFSEHTVRYYKEAITDFYQTHPGAIHQSVGGVLACLADKPRITCDQVAAQAEKYAP